MEQCDSDNSTYQNLLAWNWINETDRYFIVINFSDSPAQGRVQVVGSENRGKTWRLLDQFSSESYERDGDELLDPGLYVDLIPWDYHFFRFENPCCGKTYLRPSLGLMG